MRKKGKGGGKKGGVDADDAIEQWKIRNLIKKLSNARGAGTSMISLIIPPKGQISAVNKMLSDEYGTASNIKSRVNRLSVLGAITSAQQRLKMYHRVPPNGLCLFVGNVITDEGKEKKLSIHFEPFKTINTKLYLCDNKFHVGPLGELLEDNSSFGFIVMDGASCLYATLCGNSRKVLQKLSVELPKKHGRGGQSALRFARLRMEARHNWVRKCAELSVQHFISKQTSRPNVQGLVLAGSAAFKNDLEKNDLFDGRLREIVVKIVDVSYGGMNGFNQAIQLSAEALADVKYMAEKNLISKYMTEIAKDGLFCYGMRDTLYALEQGAIETIIVWDQLEITRYELSNPVTGENTLKHLHKREIKRGLEFTDPKTNTVLDVVKSEDFLEWLTQSYKNHGCKLEFVTDKSQEGAQFVKGFGGIGGLMRYALTFYDEEDFASDGSDGWI